MKSKIVTEYLFLSTRNAARCNNRDDLANLSFILKVFSEAYLESSRTSMMKLFVKIAESR